MPPLPLMLDAALRGSALLLLAALVALGLRRAPAALRHLTWALALGGVLVLPALTTLLPWRLPVIPVRAAAGLPAPVVIDDAPSAAVRGTSPAPATAAPVTAAPATARRAAGIRLPDWPLQRWLALVWAAGIAVAGVRLLAGAAALRWLRRGAVPLTGAGWHDALDRVCDRLGVRARITLLTSRHARTPMTWGVWRPVMVLPDNASTWDAAHREVVLLHEVAHVRRGDALAQWLSATACALYWFHPLVWRAARRLRAEAERACDDIVLGAGAPASTYAQTLLTLAQSIGRREAPVLAMPMARRSELEGRVLAILEKDVPRTAVTRRLALAGASALAIIAVPLAAMGPAVPAAKVAEHGSVRPRQGAGTESELARPRQQDDLTARSAAATPEKPSDREQVQEPPAESGAAAAPYPTPEPAVELSRSGTPLVVVGLVAALRDEDEAVRLAAARALGEQQDTLAVAALLEALRRDPSPEVRLAAAMALGEIESPRAVSGMLAAYRAESSVEVRRAIVRALGDIESSDAVEGLAAALRDRDAETRLAAIRALGEIESAAAVPVLLPLLRDTEVEVRKSAARALGEIESSTAVEDLADAWRAERDAETRMTILWALAEIEDARAAPLFEEALRDTDPAVRMEAIRGLGDLDQLRRAPAGLLAALRDADPRIRLAAVQAVGDMEDPAAVPGLISLLRDGDVTMRRAAVMALGDIRGTQAVEALVAALRDSDAEVRRLAAQALGDR